MPLLFLDKYLEREEGGRDRQQGEPRIEQQKQTRYGEQKLEGIHRIPAQGIHTLRCQLTLFVRGNIPKATIRLNGRAARYGKRTI